MDTFSSPHLHSVIQGQFPPQAKPKIFDFSPKTFLPRHFKKRLPPPQPPFFHLTAFFSRLTSA